MRIRYSLVFIFYLTPLIAGSPQLYFNQAFTLIKTNSYYRNLVNWQEIAGWYEEQVIKAKVNEDIYPIITEILYIIGDNHGLLVEPGQKEVISNEELPQGGPLKNNVGYLSLPTFNRKNGEGYAIYAQDLIYNLSFIGLQGWIIDLRNNSGGNMWPMLAGLGPFFEEGTLGSFLYLDSLVTWGYSKGEFKEGSKVMVSLPPIRADGKFTSIPIAVLVSNKTASAAEAVVIALRGRGNVCIIGETTRGLTTANQEYVLEDGAILYLAVAVFADRYGKAQEGSIIPDIAVAPPLAIETALSWLGGRF